MNTMNRAEAVLLITAAMFFIAGLVAITNDSVYVVNFGGVMLATSLSMIILAIIANKTK